jgi:preprotein translocase SecE subunit
MKSNPRPGAPARQAAVRAARAQRSQEFVQGVISEMRRVTWPSREEWIAATLLTLALVIGVGLFTYAADWLFGWLMGLLTGQAR